MEEYKKDYTYRWIVELKETKEAIGMIDVIDKDLHYKTAEVGYCYGKQYWGNGYATEVLKVILDFLHENYFDVVYAEYFKSNIGSGKVMEKAGMEYEATLKSRVLNRDGERENLIVYTSIRK